MERFTLLLSSSSWHAFHCPAASSQEEEARTRSVYYVLSTYLCVRKKAEASPGFAICLPVPLL